MPKAYVFCSILTIKNPSNPSIVIEDKSLIVDYDGDLTNPKVIEKIKKDYKLSLAARYNTSNILITSIVPSVIIGE